MWSRMVNLKLLIVEVIMQLVELPFSLTMDERHQLEDKYDELFPENRGKVTPFIRWLYQDMGWLPGVKV